MQMKSVTLFTVIAFIVTTCEITPVNALPGNESLKIYEAVRNGDLQTVKQAVAQKSLNAAELNTFLSKAACFGRIWIVEFLLMNGAGNEEQMIFTMNGTLREQSKDLAIESAKRNNHQEIVYLIEAFRKGPDAFWAARYALRLP